jgi:hypothetical protein
MRALWDAQVWCLVRMSSNAAFYTEEDVPLDDFREGRVYYWPKTHRDQRETGLAPAQAAPPSRAPPIAEAPRRT